METGINLIVSLIIFAPIVFFIYSAHKRSNKLETRVDKLEYEIKRKANYESTEEFIKSYVTKQIEKTNKS